MSYHDADDGLSDHRPDTSEPPSLWSGTDSGNSEVQWGDPRATEAGGIRVEGNVMVVMIGVSDTSDEVGRYHTVSNDGDIVWSSDDGISQENVWQGTYMDDQIEVINVMDKEERALVNQDFEQRNDVGPGIEYCGVQPVGGGQLEYTAGHNIEETTDHVEGNVTVSEDILEDDCVDGGNRIHFASNSNLCSDPDKDYGDVSE